MAKALIPLLSRNCPENGGEYGGSYQVNLDDEEAVGFGGVELVRAAVRKAARQLGWKTATVGMIGAARGTLVAVQDTRDIPEECREAVESAMTERMSAALHKMGGEPGPAPVQAPDRIDHPIDRQVDRIPVQHCSSSPRSRQRLRWPSASCRAATTRGEAERGV
ncbi:hypothetical protein OG897_32475 [Streptomyces sp. NBC_00237]|uniref:hypothetical protein n=1 Tax=Streptomyces sp. NBC_00237 TaxID=2975687 RepID=UPI00225AF198|nr:hypothetical protein [Streptomyces sp. NBC_00237]MCX5206113.1 hypothetical protein [Streptomyces sp. NBC_00237]